MGSDYETIYREHAEEYDRPVGAEDCDGALGPAIERIAPLAGAAVLEVGAGTGRLTRLLVARGARVVGFDRSEAMLAVAHRRLEEDGATGWGAPLRGRGGAPGRFGVGGHGHCGVGLRPPAIVGGPAGGRAHHHRDARHRVGDAAPAERSLAEYYAWLEQDRGFSRIELRADYLFPDVATAAEVTGSIFGAEFADPVRREGWTRVPESA